MKDDLIEELPMIVVGTKCDITGFLNNLSGTTPSGNAVGALSAEVQKPALPEYSKKL